MTSWPQPGAKCVCIYKFEYANDLQRRYAPNIPVLRQTYTVRAADLCKLSRRQVLLLEELRNPELREFGYGEIGFPPDAFRPLVTSTIEADRELFAHHLAGAGALV